MPGLIPSYTIPPNMVPPPVRAPISEEEKQKEAQKHGARVICRVLYFLAGLGGLVFIVAFDLVSSLDEVNRARLILQTTSPSLVVYFLCLVIFGAFRPADGNYITRVATINQTVPVACLMLDLAWIWTFMLNDLRFVLATTFFLVVPWLATIAAKLLDVQTVAPWRPTTDLRIKIGEEVIVMNLPVETAGKMQEAFRVKAEADRRAGMARSLNTCAIQPTPAHYGSDMRWPYNNDNYSYNGYSW
ncbi:uncharacterized protein PpBr36_09559 [Pyricularia pennisetigena]|uniref:uncharacterized protein n=1 Tax=Pyricularia pennisetigena TaxID=1578925 RepID=UPI00114D7E23|nr:uncharacterized protein PpBr36_09559 [Pyricularia pennisetigena]TLS21619.1 hypothetical protein PpBr36_09559 [Pyricularia pennisetigena]